MIVLSSTPVVGTVVVMCSPWLSSVHFETAADHDRIRLGSHGIDQGDDVVQLGVCLFNLLPNVVALCLSAVLLVSQHLGQVCALGICSCLFVADHRRQLRPLQRCSLLLVGQHRCQIRSLLHRIPPLPADLVKERDVLVMQCRDALPCAW